MTEKERDNKLQRESVSKKKGKRVKVTMGEKVSIRESDRERKS